MKTEQVVLIVGMDLVHRSYFNDYVIQTLGAAIRACESLEAARAEVIRMRSENGKVIGMIVLDCAPVMTARARELKGMPCPCPEIGINEASRDSALQEFPVVVMLSTQWGGLRAFPPEWTLSDPCPYITQRCRGAVDVLSNLLAIEAA